MQADPTSAPTQPDAEATTSPEAIHAAGLPRELARQAIAYLDLGVPALLGWSPTEFPERIAPLAAVVPEDGADPSTPGRLPFVLVLPDLDPRAAMPLTRQGEAAGYVDLNPVEPSAFLPVQPQAIPGHAYLAIDVDTGAATLGVAPTDAARVLAEAGRHPLTIAEGIATLLLNPGLLRRANAYQMLASRDGSRRIPSLWVTQSGAPRLGWCWAGNPHSWLGAASCARRAGAEA